STFLLLPRPCGNTTVPRTIWSACFGSTPRRQVSSTVSSNFANLTFCSRGIASSILSGCSGTCFLAASNFLPTYCLLWCKRANRPPTFINLSRGPTPRSVSRDLRSLDLACCGDHQSLLRNVESHRTRRAGDRLDGRFERLGV